MDRERARDGDQGEDRSRRRRRTGPDDRRPRSSDRGSPRPARDLDRRRSPRPARGDELDRRRSPGRRDLSPLSRARELESLDRSRPSPSGPPASNSASASADAGASGEADEATASEDLGRPNFAASGKLAAETNLYKGVVLKYHEPAEARKPARGWRVYVFKGKEEVDLWHLHRQSAFLVGRDRVVADIPVDHPSTSKQHAVVQFRQVRERNEFGDTKTLVKPFIIDLDSANGTSVNDEKVPPSRFYELKSGDVVKFAFSTREYVLLAEA